MAAGLTSALGGVAGGAVIGKAIVQLVGDSAALKKDVAEAQAETEAASKGMGSAVSKFSGVAKLALAGAAVAFVGFVASGVEALARWERITSQTNAVIESTGGVAGVTAEHVHELAESIEGVSSVEAESIQEGENLLLTFTNLTNTAGKGNDIFDRATQIMTDLSVALGQDMKSSAIQLGKALNDPIKGMTALRRVGVSFTQEQIDMVTRMVETNRTLDAQKLILGELQKEFGGSAAALGQTFTGKMTLFKNAVGDLSEALAENLIPTLTSWAEAATHAVEAIEPFVGAILEVAKVLGLTWVAFKVFNWGWVQAGFGAVTSAVATTSGALKGLMVDQAATATATETLVGSQATEVTALEAEAVALQADAVAKGEDVVATEALAVAEGEATVAAEGLTAASGAAGVAVGGAAAGAGVATTALEGEAVAAGTAATATEGAGAAAAGAGASFATLLPVLGALYGTFKVLKGVWDDAHMDFEQMQKDTHINADALEIMRNQLDLTGSFFDQTSFSGFVGMLDGVGDQMDELTGKLSPAVSELKGMGVSVEAQNGIWSTYQGELDASSESIDQFVGFTEDSAKRIQGLSKELGTGQISLRHFQVFMREMGITSKQSTRIAQVALDRYGKEVTKTGKVVRKFAGMSKEEFKEWADSAKGDIDDAMGSVSGFERKWAMTGRQMANTLHGMRVKSREFAQDMAELRKQDWVPEDFQKWLVEQGPDAIHAFEGSTKTAKEHMINDWQATSDHIRNAKDSVDNVDSALGRLTSQSHVVNVTVAWHSTGGPTAIPGGGRDNDPSTPWDTGGYIPGRGHKVIVAEGGEYVLRKARVRELTRVALDRLNRGEEPLVAMRETTASRSVAERRLGAPVRELARRQQPEERPAMMDARELVSTVAGANPGRGSTITVNVNGKVEKPEDIRRTLDWWARQRGL